MKMEKRKLKYIALIFILVLWSSYASAYETCLTSEGAEAKWPSFITAYYINTSGGPSGTSFAVQAGAAAWTGVDCSNFIFYYGGPTTITDHGVNDGLNIVTFGPLGVGTIAENFRWTNRYTGEILDTDIRFNSNLSWSTDLTTGTYDVQNIGAHEFGHSLCLADLYGAGDSEKTMYGFGAVDETKRRTLHYDDVDGINYLYPNPYGDDYYEENDTLATAYYPGSNWEQIWLCDMDGCGVQGDEDWYEIYVSPGYERVQIDLRFSHAEGDIDVCLYNSSGTSLACSTSTTDNEYINYVVPSGGMYYYIRVYRNNAGNAYDLWWDDLYVPPPDLIVQGISTDPVFPAPGEPVNVTVTVENQGSGDATNSFRVDFYKHLTTPPAPHQVGDAYCKIGGLAAGATTTCDVTVKYVAAGTYDMWAQVDTDENVSESNEGNNIFGPQPIHVGEVPPNVSVGLSPDATSIPRGGTLGYWVTATNNTSRKQCFEYWANVTLPNGKKYPFSGELFGPYYLCLSPYDSRSAHLTHQIPWGAPLGTYTYNAFVGPYPTVWDEDHFDFTVTKTFDVEGPEDWETTVDQDFTE